MSETTTDHEKIRKWAEKHGGKPAVVKSTHGERGVGIIRIEFPDAPNSKNDSLEAYHPSVFHASHRGGKGRQA